MCISTYIRIQKASLGKCKTMGVEVLSVTTTPSAWVGTRLLAGDSTKIRTALGIHPQLARERSSELRLFDELLPEAKFVGEIGLDGSRQFRSQWREQVAVFEHVLESCRIAGGRILSIHSRQAAVEVLDRIEAQQGAGTAILHWFSGGVNDLVRAIELGCWFSVGPAMLVSKRGIALAERMPMDPGVDRVGRSICETERKVTGAVGRWTGYEQYEPYLGR